MCRSRRGSPLHTTGAKELPKDGDAVFPFRNLFFCVIRMETEADSMVLKVFNIFQILFLNLIIIFVYLLASHVD